MNGSNILTLVEDAQRCLKAGLLSAAKLIIRFLTKYAGTQRTASFMRFVGFSLDQSRYLILTNA